MSTPRLSIIVATFNSARHILRCLDSIDTQDFSAKEVIVVDGGSSDDTVDIIRGNSDTISYWHSRPDRGIFDAWNQALGRARGEYVCFLGADDALHASTTLQQVFDAIGDDSYDLVTSRGILRDAAWKPLVEAGGPWNHAKLPRRMGVLHPGLLHRRELFERHGLFDSSLRIVGDLDFLLRMPEGLHTLDLPFPTVDVQDDGISRKQFWWRIRERRLVHARSHRVGTLRAWLYWLDKAWRMPIARLFGWQY